MNRGLAALVALLMTLNLVSCSSQNTNSQNTTVGTIAGAVIGGGAGAFVGQGVGKAVAIGVGVVGGALIGGYIGNHMDSSDNAKMDKAMNNSTYKTTAWTNRKTGNHYSMQPTSKLTAVNGNTNCRRFHSTATIEGKTQNVNGTACLQDDGTWRTIRG